MRAEAEDWISVKKELAKHKNNSPDIVDEEAFKILYEACLDKPMQANSSSSLSQHSKAKQPAYERAPSHEEEDSSSGPESSGSEVFGETGVRGDLDSESDNEDHAASDTVVSVRRRKNILWLEKDLNAPKIVGSAQLKAVTQSCGLQRLQSNNHGATYACMYCELFYRKFVWSIRSNKNTRIITTKMPNNQKLLHHAPNCQRASHPWDESVNVPASNQSITPFGREYVVLSSTCGGTPTSITNTINEKRLEAGSFMSRIFPKPVEVQQIRNIIAYENDKLIQKGGAGPSFLLDRNAGVKSWCEQNHLDQECYAEVRRLLSKIFRASEETERAALLAELNSNNMADELFVVRKCEDKDGNVLGVAFSNAFICLNLQQAIRKLGVKGINISVDGTYELSKAGWAVITMGTHSIEVDRGSKMLSHKSRPFIYMHAFSESKAVFTCMDEAVKQMALDLFGVKIESFAAVAMDHCDAARLAFTERNPAAKLLLDWPHVIMNARKKLAELWDDSANEQLQHMFERERQGGVTATHSLDAHHVDCEADLCPPLSERSRSGAVNVKHVYINRMMDDLRYLHKARTSNHFDEFSKLVLEKWREIYLQPRAADWLRDYYLTEEWACFYVSASGIIGVTPSTQHLESLHHHLKEVVVHKRRSSNGAVYGHLLQTIVTNHSKTFVGNIQRMHSSLPTSFLTLANEIILCNGDLNANFNIRESTSGPVQMYFHAAPITSKSRESTKEKHQTVTQDRIKLYEEGLTAPARESETVETFIADRMSLYKVSFDTNNNTVVCDCKDFIRLCCCAHTIVYRERVNGENIINQELGHVPTVRAKTGKKVFYNGREAGAKGTRRAKVWY